MIIMRKNVLCNLLTIMVVSVFGLVLSSSSCHNDDDDMKEKEVSLVGTWRHDFSSGYILLIFRSDGTGHMEEYDAEEEMYHYHSSEISYYYDENKERYVLILKEAGNTYYCPILYFNETTLAFINPDDETETYTRVSK